MKTIDLVDKAQMTDQQKMDLAQNWQRNKIESRFEIMYPLALEGNLQAQSNLGMLYNLGRGWMKIKSWLIGGLAKLLSEAVLKLLIIWQ